MQVKNRHNIANAVCAAALTHGYAERERILRVASEFRGLRHRCESVGNFGGVCYINSSIDSTPKRTATTLYSLSGEWIVILGGRNKGLDYRELIEPLRARARLAVLTGECGREIEKILREADIKCVYEPDFRVAVELAASLARPRESVILSPASTSFDSFSSFEERGNYFKEIIRNLHNEDFKK
jgi:UDP-N-acetylmuramoylalanine--D-glutamate ligase